MTHLSESEFVDLIENAPGNVALEPRRTEHVTTCPSCREQADAMRAVLRHSAVVDVPEPSPLFWEHLANRVRAEVAVDPGAGSGWNWVGIRGLVPLAAAMALIVAVVSGVLLVRATRGGHAAVRVADRSASTAPDPAPVWTAGTPDAGNAAVWAVLTAAASGVALQDAHDAGMQVHPGAIDHAVQDLSVAELNELGRLLQSELKRSSN